VSGSPDAVAARAAALLEAGGEGERRAVRALCGTGPVADALTWWGAQQAADGGFGTGDRLDATRRVLALLDDLGALGGAVAEGAARFATSVQHDDGSWGDASDATFLTGMLAGHLAKSRFGHTASLAAAADWLAAHFSPELVQSWRPLAACAHAFANLAHEEGDAILQWCGRELERGFRARRFDAVSVARVLVWCGSSSLPGARLDPAQLVAAIAAAEAPGGGFLAAAGAPEDAGWRRTWDALVALRRLCPALTGARSPC
jgi:hypothetical protein